MDINSRIKYTYVYNFLTQVDLIWLNIFVTTANHCDSFVKSRTKLQEKYAFNQIYNVFTDKRKLIIEIKRKRVVNKFTVNRSLYRILALFRYKEKDGAVYFVSCRYRFLLRRCWRFICNWRMETFLASISLT